LDAVREVAAAGGAALIGAVAALIFQAAWPRIRSDGDELSRRTKVGLVVGLAVLGFVLVSAFIVDETDDPKVPGNDEPTSAASPVPSQGASDEDVAGQVRRNIRRGQNRLGLDQPETALEFCSAASNLDEDSDEAHACSAEALRRDERLDEALDEIELAIEVDDDVGKWHQYRALILADMGELPDALMASAHAAELEPRSLDIQLTYVYQLGLNDFDSDATELAQRLLDEHPGSAQVLGHLALVQYWSEDVDGARATVRSAIEADGLDPWLYLIQGIIQRTAGLAERAEESYTTAIRLDDDNGRAYYLRGDLYIDQLASPELGTSDLETSTELEPSYAPAWNELGQVRLGSEDVDGAVLAQIEAVQNDPRSAPFLTDLAYAHWSRDAYDKADAAVVSAMQLEDGDPYYPTFRAYYALWPQEKEHAAAQSVRDALALDPTFAWAHDVLGELHLYGERLYEPDRAVRDLEAAIEFGETDVATRRNLARAYLQAGENRLAVANARLAITIDDEDVDSHAVLGQALWGIDEFEESGREFDRAIALDDQNAEAYTYRGYLILYSQSRFPAALRSVRRAMELDRDWWLPRFHAAWIQYAMDDRPAAERLMAEAEDIAGTGPLPLVDCLRGRIAYADGDEAEARRLTRRSRAGGVDCATPGSS
jgi:tetratricopeptide (TPR) repeat protein